MPVHTTHLSRRPTPSPHPPSAKVAYRKASVRREDEEAVQVMVRVRPFNGRELASSGEGEFPQSIVMATPGTEQVQVLDKEGCVTNSINFHQVFWSIPKEQQQYCGKEFSGQADVYEVAGKRAVETALSFKHCCIFAYGQTGSGKTHTMLGSAADPGIAPRIVDELFEKLEACNFRLGTPAMTYTVEISFMEIYNEKVKDLLSEEMGICGYGSPQTSAQSPSPVMSSPSQPVASYAASTASSAAATASAAAAATAAAAGSPGSPSRGRKRGDSGNGRRQTVPSLVRSMRRIGSVGRMSMAADSLASADYQDLKVRNFPEKGVFVEGLRRLGHDDGVCTAADVKKVMKAGMEHRATAGTAMNATSSRSHAVFQICVRAKNESVGLSRYANINLVDLAGSERLNLSKAEGQRLVEATKINLSLTTLRRVIDILIENSTKKKNEPKLRPPFRDSTLTWVLSDSLGGNSVTMMLATVSPYEGNREDTVNTLRYAEKAKSIVNHVRVNEEKCNVMLSAMQREMETLRRKMEEEVAPAEEQAREMEERMSMQRASILEQDVARRQTELEIEEREAEIHEARKLAERRKTELAHLVGQDIEGTRAREIEAEREIRVEYERLQDVLRQHESQEVETMTRLRQLQRERHEMCAAKEALLSREEMFKVEVQLAKRKQFSFAFQKAFQKAGVTSGKTNLELEVRGYSDRLVSTQLDAEELYVTVVGDQREKEKNEEETQCCCNN